jgi:hypothetical protein
MLFEHPLDSCVHFVLLYELPKSGCRQPLLDRSKEPGVFVKILNNNMLYKSLWVGSGLRRNLFDLSFLFRCEMDFHGIQPTGNDLPEAT